MIGFFFRYIISISQLNRDPEQRELAQLFIDYADGRKAWQAVFEFLEPRQWPRDVRELRITHALSMVKVWRRDVYKQAAELGRLIMLGSRQQREQTEMNSLDMDQQELLAGEVCEMVYAKGITTEPAMAEFFMTIVIGILRRMPASQTKERIKKGMISVIGKC